MRQLYNVCMIGINVIHICRPKPAKYDTHAKYKNFNKI